MISRSGSDVVMTRKGLNMGIREKYTRVKGPNEKFAKLHVTKITRITVIPVRLTSRSLVTVVQLSYPHVYNVGEYGRGLLWCSG